MPFFQRGKEQPLPSRTVSEELDCATDNDGKRAGCFKQEEIRPTGNKKAEPLGECWGIINWI